MNKLSISSSLDMALSFCKNKDKIIEIFSKVSTNEESNTDKFQKMLSGLKQIAEKVVNEP